MNDRYTVMTILDSDQKLLFRLHYSRHLNVKCIVDHMIQTGRIGTFDNVAGFRHINANSKDDMYTVSNSRCMPPGTYVLVLGPDWLTRLKNTFQSLLSAWTSGDDSTELERAPLLSSTKRP